MIPGLVVNAVYATPDNVFGKRFYSQNRLFLVEPAARALARAQEFFVACGLCLEVWDAYRPLSVQREFWDRKPDRRYVAPPEIGSKHNRGAAVDVTLLDHQGKRLRMPTDLDTFSRKAHANAFVLSRKTRNNRRVLQQGMTSNGYLVIRTEWWHFDFVDWREFPILDIDFAAIDGSS
jgi:D-alanyl-D-alanine dipeptidase